MMMSSLENLEYLVSELEISIKKVRELIKNQGKVGKIHWSRKLLYWTWNASNVYFIASYCRHLGSVNVAI